MDDRKDFRWFLGIDISKETFAACCISSQEEKQCLDELSQILLGKNN